MKSAGALRELRAARPCDKIAKISMMRMSANKVFRSAAAVVLAGLLALCGVVEATRSVSPGADTASISSQSKKKKSAKTKAKTKGKGRAAAPDAAPAGPFRVRFSPRPNKMPQPSPISRMPLFFGNSEPEFLSALPTMRGPWLILSAGGEDGAYGAGFLADGARPANVRNSHWSLEYPPGR